MKIAAGCQEQLAPSEVGAVEEQATEKGGITLGWHHGFTAIA